MGCGQLTAPRLLGAFMRRSSRREAIEGYIGISPWLIVWGGNFGRDADTIGAIIGALCGARHGLQIIPPAWVEQVRRPSGVCLKFAAHEDIPTLAAQLANLIN